MGFVVRVSYVCGLFAIFAPQLAQAGGTERSLLALLVSRIDADAREPSGDDGRRTAFGTLSRLITLLHT